MPVYMKEVIMNIPQIMGFRYTSPFRQNKQQQSNVTSPNFGLIMAEPLSQDTVSFQATVKKLSSRTNGVSLHVAKIINEEAQPMQERVRNYLHSLFGDLVATDLNPNNPIYAIKDRAKSAGSIVEKSATRQWNCKAEVLDFMTDLNGAKIVMKDGSKKAVQKVLQRFFGEIENGSVELLEIENKRPIVTQNYKRHKKTQFDYASTDFLEDMQRAQEDKWDTMNLKERKFVRVDLNDLTDVNYMATHFLFKLPGEIRPFELVVLGKNVNTLKDLDDLLFKILNNKNVAKKYKPIVDIVKPLTEDGNEDLLETFNQYRRDAFIFQREKQTTTFVDDGLDFFLPLKYNLPARFDLNNLYRIMQECDAKAEAKTAKTVKRQTKP